MDMQRKLVCVTGASGYIASWLVKLLLKHGYTVRATVRDPNDSQKTKHLLALSGAKERLHIFKANLMEEGSFDSVVDGCEGIFHTASPVLLTPEDPKIELLDPAIKGTLNVLASCSNVSTVKRVVITSSIVSAAYNKKPLTTDVMVDETWFSDPIFCKESKLWYVLSKTLAEEAAYKFSKESGIDLVTLHPGFVIGPFLQPAISLSIEMFLKLINGGQSFPNAVHRYVDVRDVAEAHIKALESPSAKGRYCLVTEVLHNSEAMEVLQKLYPDLPLPKECEDKKPFIPTYKVSKEKVKSLGISFTPLEVTFKDTVDSLKEKGFLNP